MRREIREPPARLLLGLFVVVECETVSNAEEALGNLFHTTQPTDASKLPAICANLMQQGGRRLCSSPGEKKQSSNWERDP